MLMPPKTMSLASLLADRTKRLIDYQSAGYARRYESFVQRVANVEKSRVGGERLAREVAVSLYKLMAYKDEYEVARLYADSDFRKRIADQFEGDYKLTFHMAPPIMSETDPATGELIESYTMLTMNADAHPLIPRMHKPDPKFAPQEQDKRSVVVIEATDFDVWLCGSIEDARALIRLAPVEVFEAGPDG